MVFEHEFINYYAKGYSLLYIMKNKKKGLHAIFYSFIYFIFLVLIATFNLKKRTKDHFLDFQHTSLFYFQTYYNTYTLTL